MDRNTVVDQLVDVKWRIYEIKKNPESMDVKEMQRLRELRSLLEEIIQPIS